MGEFADESSSLPHVPKRMAVQRVSKIGGYLCFWMISWKVAYLEFWTIRCLSFNHCLEGRENFWIVLEAGLKFVCLYKWEIKQPYT
uniref:Uncharacterized protein n=1 Tax=Noccaea caerulescens TaxID=107243 RepID=A0A1J3F0W6_NOCCA